MPRYELITFDCYGTMIDWEAGIWDAFQHAACDARVELDRANVLQTYSEIEPLVQAEAFRSYREVLQETAERTAARLGWKLPTGRGDFLAKSLPNWPPFPDTNAALTRLAEAGVALAILSNVDDDLLAQTWRHFPVGLEFWVTAQQVRSYKPAPGHFEAARSRAARRPKGSFLAKMLLKSMTFVTANERSRTERG